MIFKQKCRQKYKLLSIFLFGLIYITLKNNNIFAMSQSDAGKYISEFSANFFDNYADQTVYSYEDNQRNLAYQGIKTTGITSAPYYKSFNDKYAFDCVGWVSFVIHQSLGLGSDTQMTFFGQPRGYGQIGAFFNGFTTVMGNPNSWTKLSTEELYQTIKPGDLLLCTYQHIMIYIGDDQVIHCTGGGPGKSYGGNKGYGIVRNKLSELNYEIACIGRITENKAASINQSDATTIFNGKLGITGSWINYGDETTSKTVTTGKGWIVDPDDKLELFKHILLTEKYNFNYINWERYGHGVDSYSSTGSSSSSSTSASTVGSNGPNKPSDGEDNSTATVNENEGYKGTFTDTKNRTYKEFKQEYGPYKDQDYSKSTMAKAGCGPTSVAIIASAYGINKTPGDIGKFMVGDTGPEKIRDTITSELKLTCTLIRSNMKEKLEECLKAGRPAIISTLNKPTTTFTKSDHVCAALSINDEGKVWVSNPNPARGNGWYDLDFVAQHLKYIVTIDSDK